MEEFDQVFIEKIVKFSSPEIAGNVAQHLYGVELDGDRLIFSKFDKQAFNLAVGLTGLDNAAYSFIDKNGRAYSNPDSALLVLAVELEFRRPSYSDSMPFFYLEYSFDLLIDRVIEQSPDFDDFSLVVNAQLLEFALTLERETSSVIQDYVSTIESASLRLCRDGFLNSLLMINSEGHTRILKFSPTNVSITSSSVSH